MAVFDIEDAKRDLLRLIDDALAGEEIVIGRNGKPLVRLVPVPRKPEARVPGRLKGRVWISPDFELTDEEIDDFEAPL